MRAASHGCPLTLPILCALLLTLLSFVHSSRAAAARLTVLPAPVLGNATSCGCFQPCNVKLDTISFAYRAVLFQAQLLVEPVGGAATVTIAFGPRSPLAAGVTLRVRPVGVRFTTHCLIVWLDPHQWRLFRHLRDYRSQRLC